MKCPNCNGTNLEMMADMTVSFPAEWERKLTKKKMLKKEFKIWGVNWFKADIICKDCGYTIIRDK